MKKQPHKLRQHGAAIPKITPTNYEAWLLDWYDNKLTQPELKALESFFSAQPQYKPNLGLTPLPKLDPQASAAQVSGFKGINHLLKNDSDIANSATATAISITPDNYESYLLDYLEGNLPAHLQLEMEAFLKQHPHLNESPSITQLKLVAPAQTNYPYTQLLIKPQSAQQAKTDGLGAYFNRFGKYLAAASVVLLLLASGLMFYKPNTNKPALVANKQAKTEMPTSANNKNLAAENNTEAKTANMVSIIPDDKQLATKEPQNLPIYTAKKSEKLNNSSTNPINLTPNTTTIAATAPAANLASPKQYSLNELPSRKSPQTLLATPTTTNGNLVSPLNEFMAANYGNTLIKDNNTSEASYQEDDQTFTIAPIEQIYNLLGKKKEGFRIPKSLLPEEIIDLPEFAQRTQNLKFEITVSPKAHKIMRYLFSK